MSNFILHFTGYVITYPQVTKVTWQAGWRRNARNVTDMRLSDSMHSDDIINGG